MSFQGYGQGSQGFPSQPGGGWGQPSQQGLGAGMFPGQPMGYQAPNFQAAAGSGIGTELAAQVSLPFIEHSDLANYENLFKQANPSSTGHIAAPAARNILVQSGLPNEILARIWSLSAVSTSTSLNFAEFCLAMHLAKLGRNGTMPPPQLPDTVRQQLMASTANLTRAAQGAASGGGGLSAPLGSYTGSAGVTTNLTGGHGSTGYLTPTSTGNASFSGVPRNSTTGMSRSSSFQGVPSGVTVMDGFAGPLVAQAPIQSQSSQGQRQKWAVDPAEKAQYDAIFKVWDPQNSGFISGDRARNIFTQSGLPDGVLAHIWTLADIQKNGKLNADEFAVAMHLVYQKLNGRDLPATLPPELIPPSTRDLDSLTNLAKTQIMSDIVNKKTNPLQRSPFGSSSNLFGIADPLGSFGSTSPNLSDRRKLQEQRDQEEAKRKTIVEKLETKKRELAELRQKTADTNKSATQIQLDIDRLHRDAREGHSDVKYTTTTKESLLEQLQSRSGSGSRGGAETIDQAMNMEKEIRNLLDDCRAFHNKYADQKIQKLRGASGAQSGSGTSVPGGISTLLPNTGSSDPVQSKAAALLAARMAALGVSGPSPSPLSSSPSEKSSSNSGAVQAEIAKVEEERRRRLKELDDASDRVRSIMEQVRSSAPSNASSLNIPRIWNPPVEEKLKFEQGVGLKSKTVRKVIEDLDRQGGYATSTSSWASSNTQPLSAPRDSDAPARKPSLSSSAISTSFPSVPSVPRAGVPDRKTDSTPTSALKSPDPWTPAPPVPAREPPALSFLSNLSSSSAPLNGGNHSPVAGPSLPSPTSAAVNDVVAQAEAAIRAAKERQAKRLAGAGTPTTPGTPTGAGSGNPFGASSTSAGTIPATTTGSESTAFNAFSNTSFGAPKPAEEDDEVSKAMQRLREQEQQLLGENFRLGAGNVGASVPAPTVNNRSQENHPSTVTQGVLAAMEKIRQREKEVLAEQQRIMQEDRERKEKLPAPRKSISGTSAQMPDRSVSSGSGSSFPRSPLGISKDAFQSAPSKKEQGITPPSNAGNDQSEPRTLSPPLAPAISVQEPPEQDGSLPKVGGPPPPPPPPPPGEVKPVKKYVRGTASPTSSGESTPKRKPTLADVGARVPALFAAGAAPVQSIGKVSDRIKNLQGGMAHIFGAPVAIGQQEDTLEHSSHLSPTQAEGTSSGLESDWEVVSKEDTKNHEQLSKDPTLNVGFTTKGGFLDIGASGALGRAVSIGDVFSDKFASSPLHPDPVVISPITITPADAGSILYKARAAYAYEGGADDLRLDVGDVVQVEQEQGEWLYGRVDGRAGWFPKTYVDVIAEDSVVDTARAPTPALLSSRFISRGTALWDYTALQSDEVDLVAGETVGILEKPEQEWWKVENSRGEAGLVPSNYLQEAPDEDGIQLDDTSTAPAGASGGTARSSATELFGKPIESRASSVNSSFYESASDAGAGHATPPLPPKNKVHVMPRSSSLNIHSLAAYGEDEGSEGRPSIGLSSRESNFEDEGDRHVLRSGIPKSTSFAVQPSQASTAWATKVDPYRLQTIAPDERKRQEAIYELIATEQTYVRDLELIYQTFYGPMSQILPHGDLEAVFSNIEDIKMVNAVILSDLEAVQQEHDFVIEAIGDVFCKHADSLSVYQTYCGNFGNALKVLQKQRSENPRVAEYLKRQQTSNPLCRSLDLSSFLLQPMQRITRYSLLLKQILHHTSKTHPDHESVVRALAMSEKAAEMVNTAARERESREKLEEVMKILDLTCDEEHRLDLSAPTRVLGPRIFVHEGPLMKSKSGRKLHAYLFNDVLLLAQPKGKQDRNARGYQFALYRKPMPLNEIAVRDLPKLAGRDHGAVDETCFQVIHGQDAVTVRAPSVAAKRKWVNTLEEQSRHYYMAEKQQAEGSWKGGRFTYGTPIGTLQVMVAEAKNLVRVDRGHKLDLFCRVQLNRQQVKTRTVHSVAPRWNQALVFSVLSLDETLKISVYNYDRYSQDDYLGQAELALDFLEYYGEKETEPITLGLRDVASGSVVIRLMYRKT
ncbi:uncharacterized protein SPPG_07456 [Spizellomyces punctatus DAOM BR117]|uniref:Actin cytoskeleton-regulatory complex protein pan1 n=1 Tax=Spizellomyces punctatus (strain DAOM BR117) TaxID=645134 RepID=A0A0L0H805_SPIPD|nr:uncharacterized protein SPPG_07456 [Spizellomyces punctatus DAOM BR117]KNC97059.1 hypothetical protein SPPG_07456 [Spizellomyces punctatus DAOM BR117]|eukprot:XP_016605099.1 hypothetical protein SPPG_07456 [Spizellomyces punctatus DAOM BR117]